MSEKLSPLTVLLWTTLAAVGGIVRHLATSMEHEFPPDLNGRMAAIYFVRLAATGMVAGFTGLLFALLVSTLTGDTTVQFVAAGISGYSGPKTLDMLYRYFIGKFLTPPNQARS